MIFPPHLSSWPIISLGGRSVRNRGLFSMLVVCLAGLISSVGRTQEQFEDLLAHAQAAQDSEIGRQALDLYLTSLANQNRATALEAARDWLATHGTCLSNISALEYLLNYYVDHDDMAALMDLGEECVLVLSKYGDPRLANTMGIALDALGVPAQTLKLRRDSNRASLNGRMDASNLKSDLERVLVPPSVGNSDECMESIQEFFHDDYYGKRDPRIDELRECLLARCERGEESDGLGEQIVLGILWRSHNVRSRFAAGGGEVSQLLADIADCLSIRSQQGAKAVLEWAMLFQEDKQYSYAETLYTAVGDHGSTGLKWDAFEALAKMYINNLVIPEKASALLTDCLSEDSPDKIHTLLAHSHYVQEQYKDAAKVLDSFLRARPRTPLRGKALFALGSCQFKLGEEEAARKTWEEALPMIDDPQIRSVIQRLGQQQWPGRARKNY